MHFLPHSSSPVHRVFAEKFDPEILAGSLSLGSNKGCWGKQSMFYLYASISRNDTRYVQHY